MKTKNKFPNQVNMSPFVILPLFIFILLIATSCAAKKTSRSVKTEIAPPPPPPPPPPSTTPFVVVEEMPMFPGGDSELMKYIASNIKYPETAKENNIQGKVIVRFCITETGSINQVSVLRGVNPDLDAEALRVVSSLPPFKPGRQGGKEVPVWYMVPISFSLDGGKSMYPPSFEINGSDTIYFGSDEQPQFPGGKEALQKFKTENLVYSSVLKNLGIEGMVYVGFIIRKDGSISDPRISMGVSPSLDAEAMRVTRLMPVWQPGKINGKPVNTYYGVNYEFFINPEKRAVFSDGDVVVVEESPTDESDEPFVVVEQMPMFPGGDSALIAYIAQNTKYPEAAKKEGIQGRVIVRFCVTKTGEVDRVSVLRGVSPDLDAEAIRVVKNLPSFKPGVQGGKPVNVWYMVPINFSLGTKESANKMPPDREARPKFADMGYDEPPVFPGGEEAINKFIISNIVYPQTAKVNKLSGKVIVRFCINADGSVNPVTVFKGINPELDKEAVRVVSMMPSWIPGKLKGVPVRVWYALAVPFSLK